MCVCLQFVSLSVCLHNSKTTLRNFTEFFVHVVYGPGLFTVWWRCNKLCTSWGLYYMFIEPSLAGGFLWQSAVCWPPIGPLAPAICYPHWQLSPHPDAPDPGVMACHSLTRTQVDPLVPCPRIISCRNLTRHAGRGGRRTHALPNSQPGFYCTAARDR